MSNYWRKVVDEFKESQGTDKKQTSSNYWRGVVDDFKASKQKQKASDEAARKKREEEEAKRKAAQLKRQNARAAREDRIAQQGIHGKSGVTHDIAPYRKQAEKKDAQDLFNEISGQKFSLVPSMTNKGNPLGGNLAPLAEMSEAAQEKQAEKKAKENAKKTEKKPGKADFLGMDLFQKGAFENGVKGVGDALKKTGQTALGTVGDVAVSATEGMVGGIESLLDLGSYGVGGVGDLLGFDDFADSSYKTAENNMTQNMFGEMHNWLDEYSVLGNTTDAAAGAISNILLTQGLGEIAAAGKAASAGATAVKGAKGGAALSRLLMSLQAGSSGITEAREDGASDRAAFVKGAGSAGIAYLTEAISGGLGDMLGKAAPGISQGVGALDDKVANWVTQKISNVWFKNTVQSTIKALGEGFEENAETFLNVALDELTYKYNDSESFAEALADENWLEELFIGTITSMALQAPGTIKASKGGRDYVTGRTKTEQSIIDKVVEDRVKEAETGDKKLSSREKNKISEEVIKAFERGGISTDTIEEMLAGDDYKAWREADEKDEAELKELKTLRGTADIYLSDEQRERRDELKARREAIENKVASGELRAKLDEKMSEMVKDSPYLRESYLERERKYQALEVDTSQYESEAARKSVDNLVAKKYINNTYKQRQFAESVAKYASRSGKVVSFATAEELRTSENAFRAVENFKGDGTNTTFDFKLKKIDGEEYFKPVVTVNGVEVSEGYKIDFEKGSITFETAPTGDVSVQYQKADAVNGFHTKDGVTINLDSPMVYDFILGHEGYHSVEGTDAGKKFAKVMIDYAKKTGVYEAMKASRGSTYNEGTDIESEIVADLAGQYIFDEDFVNDLAYTERNTAQKVLAWIKHQLKMVVAGSPEARRLEQGRYLYEKALDQAAKTGSKASGVKHSLGYHAGDLGKAEYYHQQSGDRGTGHFGTGTYFVGDEAKISGNDVYGKRPHHAVEFDNYNLYKIKNDDDGFSLHRQLKVIDGGVSQEFLDAVKQDKFKPSELRKEAWDRAKSYENEDVWDDDLMMFVPGGDYIEAGIQGFAEVAQENGVEVQNYDEWLAAQSDDMPKPGDDDYDFYKYDYYDYLKEAIEEADAERNKGYDDFSDAYFKLWMRFGKAKVNDALQAVVEHDKKMRPNGEYDYFTAREKKADSRATIFMKYLGYEGIDVRGTKLDNTEYGSVIYDLKDDSVQYSLNEYSEQQKKNWENSKRIVIYKNNNQLSSFIQDAIANKITHKKMYFGAISSDLATRIKADTGLNVENYNLSLGAYEIRKILKDHGDETAEATRGQRAITEDDFSHIVDVVLNPSSIERSDQTYMGKPAIVFTGEHNGRMNVVAVVSDKRLDLFVQTVYVNRKKENLATPIDEQASINTPEANNGTVFSEKSISQKEDAVNRQYLDAVNRGDTETAQRLVDEAADKVMPNSILRDGNAITKGEETDGTLIKMFHGSGAKGFYTFEMHDGMLGKGIYLTSNWDEAVGYAMDKLGIEDDGYSYTWNGEDYDSLGAIGEALESEGYVRAFYANVTDSADIATSSVYREDVIALVRDRNQLKSADPVTYDDKGNVIPLSERFNAESDDIRYSLTSELDGEPIESDRIVRDERDNKYSLTFSEDIAKGQKNWIVKNEAKAYVSDAELEEAQRVTKAMVDVMMKYSSILPEDKIDKVLTKNGSYDRSVENTTICVRTLAYNEFVDKVQEEIGRPLTQMESFLVSQKLYDIATEPQCLYCYVSLDRKSFNEMLLRYMQDRDTVIAKYNKSDKSKASVDALYQEFLNGRKDTDNMKNRFNTWRRYADNGTQLLSLADIATNKRQSAIAAEGGVLAEQLADARDYAQKASWSKIQKDYVAYRDEILKLGDRVVKNLNEHYGMRWYSFSDYSAAFIVENMQQITDASIRGLKGLSYTKDTDYAEIFAPSGMNINVSVFVNRDSDGNFFIDEKQSANFEKALELREKYPNVGIVATVTDDEGLRWAASQEWSDVIIPFHIVRTGTDVAEYYKWLNYTSESGDSVKDQSLWDAYVDSLNPKTDAARKKISKNIYPSEHKNNRDTYLRLCESRGLSPRFARFAGEPWYMKLVNETRLSADATPALKPIFDEDAAKASFAKFVEKGGYEGGWYKDGVDVDAEAKLVADDVIAGKKANEVDYGRQDGFDPEAVMARRKNVRNHGKHSLYNEDMYFPGGTPLRDLRVDDGRLAPPVVGETVGETSENVIESHDNVIAPPVPEERMDMRFREGEDYVNPIDARDEAKATQEAAEAQARENLEMLMGEDQIAPPVADEAVTPTIAPPVPGEVTADEDIKITTMKEKLTAKKANSEEELTKNLTMREKVKADYDEKINALQAEYDSKVGSSQTELETTRQNMNDAVARYDEQIAHAKAQLDGKKRKDTKAAQALLRRISRLERLKADEVASYTKRIQTIEARLARGDASALQRRIDRLKRMQANVDADYAKRISDLEARIERRGNEIEAMDKRWDELATDLASDIASLTLPEEAELVGGRKTKSLVTEPPNKRKNKRGIISLVKEYVLDNGMVFEDVAKKTKNRQLEADWNMIRNAKSMAQRFLKKGVGKHKSIVDLEAEIEKKGLTEEFYNYMHHLLNIDRMSIESKAQADIKTIVSKNPVLAQLISRNVSTRDILNDPLFKKNAESLRDDVDEIIRLKQRLNKPVVGGETAKTSRVKATHIEEKHPEFKEYAEAVYATNRQLRNLLVEEGIITRETADLWEEMNPHYVPLRRNKVDIYGKEVKRKKGTRVNAPLKYAEGGDADILPMFNSIALRAEQTYRAILKNRFGKNLMNTLGTSAAREAVSLDDVENIVDYNSSLLQPGDDITNPTFTVFENGERVTFDISEEMYDAMKPTGAGLGYTNKHLNRFSNFFRNLLTEYNLPFIATNAIKDAQDVLINSQHPAHTYGAIPRAVKEMATGGRYYTEYLDNGGEQNTYFDDQDLEFKEDEQVTKVLKTVTGLNLISKANHVVEMTPRLAEYIASREAGRSIEVSMLDAARVTTNFAAGGKLTKMLNRNGATFLGASVNGAMQQVRNVREAKMNGLRGWAGLAGKAVIAGVAASVLNGLIWDDDDEYEELSDYIKQNYYIVGKFGDGKFVRIPKGRTVAVIQDAFKQIQNAATGDDEVDMASFIQLVVNNLAPNNPFENNVLAPILQVKNNETWYGSDLVPSRLQDLPDAEQYDETTDAISKWLGEKLDVSPYKLNYLFDQYTGGVGDMLLPMITPESETGNDSVKDYLTAPFRDKFTTDSVLKNQNVSDFYDMKSELTTNAKSSKATDEDILKSKYINSISDEIAELQKQKREIQASDEYSKSEKYYLTRDIQQKIVDLTYESLNDYSEIDYHDSEHAQIGDRIYEWYEPTEGEPYWRKMNDAQKTKYLLTKDADGYYVTDGNVHYRLDEDGEWTKISDKQLERQNEVTEELGITPEEYWSKTEVSFFPNTDGEYEYAYENPEKYEFFTKNGVSYEDYDSADKKTKSAYNWAAKDEDRYDFLVENGVSLTDTSAFDTEEKKSAWTWAYKNPEKYELSKAITGDVVKYKKYTGKLNDIRADKDENGDSISGSAKEKKIDYINGLDLDYGQKIILFRSLYNADDTYNYDIIDYLNERDDISAKEMRTILEELDFTVDDEGNISW